MPRFRPNCPRRRSLSFPDRALENVRRIEIHLLLKIRPRQVDVREDLGQKGPLIQADVLGQLRTSVQLAVSELKNLEERLQNAFSANGHRAYHRFFSPAPRFLYFGLALGVRQVALVELDHHRNFQRIEPVLEHVLVKILPVGVVVLGRGPLAVGDERNRVRALKNYPASRVMDDLSRDGEELDLHPVTTCGAEEYRQQIEKKSSIVPRLHGEQSAADLGLQLLVDHLQICRLARKTRAVIDDFDRQLALRLAQLQVCLAPGEAVVRARWGEPDLQSLYRSIVGDSPGRRKPERSSGLFSSILDARKWGRRRPWYSPVEEVRIVGGRVLEREDIR